MNFLARNKPRNLTEWVLLVAGVLAIAALVSWFFFGLGRTVACAEDCASRALFSERTCWWMCR